MNRNTALALAILTASGTAASADVFFWGGGDGDWGNHALWIGPGGQVPDSILDSATLSGDGAEVTLSSNVSVGSLNVLNGLDLFTVDKSMFVGGNTVIDGSGSAIAVRSSPSLHDFDTDELRISNGGILVLGDGLVQADESILVESQSGILGLGVVEMNSTTGDLVLDGGVLLASANATETDTLLIQRTQSSTSELDWSSPECSITVWDNKHIDVQIPFSGALGGRINVSSGSEFLCSTPFVAGQGSELRFFGGELGAGLSSTISAPTAIDSYGLVQVQGHGTIETDLLALRGEGSIYDDGVLVLDTTLTMFDSFVVTPNEEGEGDGGGIEFRSGTTTLNVNGGVTSIDTGAGGWFDLDGIASMTTNISDGSSLILDVEFIERFESNVYNGTLNIDGTLELIDHASYDAWNNLGEIELDTGVIKGRDLNNRGMISGTGTIFSRLFNDGELVADGGTMFLKDIDLDGDNNGNELGVIRAQTGDMSVSNTFPSNQDFRGSMFIGDGMGVQEVFESNLSLTFHSFGGSVGSLDMNSGRLASTKVVLDSLFSTTGDSLISVYGTDSDEYIEFGSEGTNTITGTLELTGNVFVKDGADFLGEGTIAGNHTHRTIDLEHGASLGDVSLQTVGRITLGQGTDGIGHASVAGLTLLPGSELVMDLAGEHDGVGHDRIKAFDQVMLDGTLVLDVVDGFSVQTGEVFTIIEGSSISGGFDHVDSVGLGLEYGVVIEMHDDRVDVVITCRVDLNQDGLIDFFDVSDFLDAFGAMEPAADFTGDGLYDFFDVSEFLDQFGAGCP